MFSEGSGTDFPLNCLPHMGWGHEFVAPPEAFLLLTDREARVRRACRAMFLFVGDGVAALLKFLPNKLLVKSLSKICP